LKRRNYSAHTVKHYLNDLKQFLLWVDVPIEEVTVRNVANYIEFLLERRKRPKTINCHLYAIRRFYDYLHYEEDLKVAIPVKRGCCVRMPKPLPAHLKDEEAALLLQSIRKPRDRAIFTLMLRTGLRVAEVASLTLPAIDFRRGRLLVYAGKGNKGRLVYISPDAMKALVEYLRYRPSSRSTYVFLVEKGPLRGQPLSIRGIQKRMEYYARKAGIRTSCHQLRHTMATQMLNAGAPLATIQDLLGHSSVTTTQRYCKVSNLRVQQDYYKAMDAIMKKSALGHSAS
jgi:site-specific recombinase XerD